MATSLAQPGSSINSSPESLSDKLNGVWHKHGLQVFMVIVLGHWAEHIFQAYQIWVLHWPRPKAGGLLGLFYPKLITSESLHYGYAIVMLIGIWIFRTGFQGTSRKWWTAALVIQFWHHIEHLLLFCQAQFHHNLFGKPVPTSIVQLWFPRVELHLFYNTVVFVPMVIAMYYHMVPPFGEENLSTCTCALHKPKLDPSGAGA